MPQKSTDFYPKLLSGLTIYKLDQEGGPPGPRPTSSPACACLEHADTMVAARPGGRARTRASALLLQVARAVPPRQARPVNAGPSRGVFSSDSSQRRGMIDATCTKEYDARPGCSGIGGSTMGRRILFDPPMRSEEH